jgi:hypothetical protein
MAQPSILSVPQFLLFCSAAFCPEFFLLLSVWLSSGWNGLLLHSRAELSTACGVGRKVCEVPA